MKIVWSLAAANDLDRIQAYWEQRSPRVAQRMWVRIHERVGGLASFPLSAPLHRDGPARKLVVTGTPYVVLYTVSGGELAVEAVFHGAQDF